MMITQHFLIYAAYYESKGIFKTEVLVMSIGILRAECIVLPFIKSNEAIPVVAQVKNY